MDCDWFDPAPQRFKSPALVACGKPPALAKFNVVGSLTEKGWWQEYSALSVPLLNVFLAHTEAIFVVVCGYVTFGDMAPYKADTNSGHKEVII